MLCPLVLKVRLSIVTVWRLDKIGGGKVIGLVTSIGLVTTSDKIGGSGKKVVGLVTTKALGLL